MWRVGLAWAMIMFLAAGCMSHSTAANVEEQPVTEQGERAVDDEPIAEDRLLAAGNPEDGAGIYNRVCVTCHGRTGDGRGLEQELFPFDAPEERWTHGPTVEGILTTLEDGIHETSMQPFPEYGEVERRAVAKYVLELREALLDREQ
jgi:mono/diheme cytochrome c family protein